MKFGPNGDDLYTFTASSPNVNLHASPFSLESLVSQDGPPPKGRRTDGLFGYGLCDSGVPVPT
jgi:hypothetical protein